MKFLKAVALSIMSFLLFLSLSAFGLIFALNSTVLNPGFVTGEVDKLDVPAVVKELVEQQAIVQLPPEMRFVKSAVYEFIAAEQPWLKQQLKTAVNIGYDYFLGKSNRLSLSIPLDALKERLKEKIKPVLKQTFVQLRPPELVPAQMATASQQQLEQYFEQYFTQYWQQFATQVPDRLEIDESKLPADVLRQFAVVRQYISYFQLSYKLLIALMLLFVLGIVLIHRELKSAAREIGVVLLSYGAFEYAGIFLAQYFLPGYLSAPAGIPPTLWNWLTGLLNDVMSPLGMFSLACVVVGVILLVISFIVKTQTAEAGE